MWKKILIFGVWFFHYFSPLSVWGQEKPSAPTPLKEIRVAYFSQDPIGLDPLGKNFDPDSYAVSSQLFDSLVHADIDGNLIPGLATSWKNLSPTVWSFRLREGVKFHNGEEFNAESVKFTLDYMINPANQTGNTWILSPIKSTKIIGPHEVQIETKEPDGMFLNRLLHTAPICPPKYILQNGIEHFHRQPVGTGPFKFEKWEKGKEIVLTANEAYWIPDRPRLQKVRFVLVPEDKWVQALEKDQVDFVPNLAGHLTRQLVANKKANVKIVKRLVLAQYLVLLNNRGPLAKLNVRKALNHAIDKDSLVKFADVGNAQPLASLGKEGEFGSDMSLKIYEYNPQKAKALLTESGHGKGMKLKMLAADVGAPVAKIMKSNFSSLGIKVSLDVVSRPTFMGQIISHKLTKQTPVDYDLAVVFIDNPIYTLGFPAMVFLESHSPASFLNSPEFDQKLTSTLQTVDPRAFKERLQELDRYIHDEALMLFTTQRVITAAVRKEFTIDTFGLNGHLDYNVLSTADKSK